jgi:micrococcal nuclease
VEEVLLREGLGWLVAIPPNVAWLARLQKAEAVARRDRLGVWAIAAYTPRAAAQLHAGDTGFRHVQGTITRVGQSAHAIYLDLGPLFTIVIPRDDWQTWFGGNPQHWRGRHVTASGWVSPRGTRLRMRVRHPAMLTSERTD